MIRYFFEQIIDVLSVHKKALDLHTQRLDTQNKNMLTVLDCLKLISNRIETIEKRLGAN